MLLVILISETTCLVYAVFHDHVQWHMHDSHLTGVIIDQFPSVNVFFHEPEAQHISYVLESLSKVGSNKAYEHVHVSFYQSHDSIMHHTALVLHQMRAWGRGPEFKTYPWVSLQDRGTSSRIFLLCSSSKPQRYIRTSAARHKIRLAHTARTSPM
jgi:hypothetical protein